MTKRRVTIVFTRRATAEVDEALGWWAENRHSTDLADAIAAALDLLERFPEIAPPRPRYGRRTRRYALDRLGYHHYYRFDGRSIVVLTLWHERRQSLDL